MEVTKPEQCLLNDPFGYWKLEFTRRLHRLKNTDTRAGQISFYTEVATVPTLFDKNFARKQDVFQSGAWAVLSRTSNARHDLTSIRQHLLRLYSDLLRSKIFLKSRPHVKKILQLFDRPAYLQALERQLQAIGSLGDLPEAFEIFILEWPTLAAFDCMWPGLPYGWCEDDGDSRRTGWNFLANIPPGPNSSNLEF